MIVKEYYTTRTDGVKLFITYSDANLKIRKIGTSEIYDIAVDVENSTYSYKETDILMDKEDEEIK